LFTNFILIMNISNSQPLKFNFLSYNETEKNADIKPEIQKNNCAEISPENYRAYIKVQNCDKISAKGVKLMGADERFIELRDKFCEELEPKSLRANIACWDFYINSTAENMQRYEKTQDEVYELYQNEELYKNLQELEKEGLKDKHLNKQLKDLTKEFDEELNTGELKKALREKENVIASKYNSYIPKINGKETSKTEITKLLQTEKNPEIRKNAYDAKIKGGDVIADDMVEFVKMRNEFARSKGYKNYFEYSLKETYDVDADYLQGLLDEVYENAKGTNKKLQAETKKELADEYGIDEKELLAYHYGLLSDSNPQKEINKSIKTKEQVVEIAKNAYSGMGYNIDEMPVTLDMFPRKNKNTHGFCFGIDAGKDARILANLTNDSNSIDTACHEMGHCVYHLGVDMNLPYLDRDETPALTEAVAMMMGDLQQKENILKGIVPDDTLEKFKADYKKSEAKFINRSMLIISFEKSMYEDPEQDLGKRWHDLKCKYTGANESEEINNEWATIPHYLSHPGYYQNYFRANLMKAQIYNHLTEQLGALTENRNTAKYLNDNLFKYGRSIDENDLIKKFTGEPLSSKALCENLK
ncbi:MAG: M2 family metallopeptidase, partial [Candidatus Gastranaerophilales bacterium]|nr:M2 family metallopeptidase [Candidatus Gastranaerophilales bacterium]